MSHFKIAVGVFLTILFGSVIIHRACEKNLNINKKFYNLKAREYKLSFEVEDIAYVVLSHQKEIKV